MNSFGQGRLEFDPDLLDGLDGFDGLDTSVAAPITEDAAKGSVDALLASAGRYGNPEDYRALVQFVGRLPTYSPFNRMLVHIQDRGAVYVATSSRWRSEFGRAIRPGARPIIVLQPRGPVMVVFDVRHTEPFVENPRPVPTSVTDPIAIGYTTTEAEIRRRWERIAHNAIRDGIRISFADHGGHSGGSTTLRHDSSILLQRPNRGRGAVGTEVERFLLRYDVVVNGNLSLRDQYTTLVHELAHVYCGHLGSPNEKHWPSRPTEPLEAREVEAESVVHMLVSRVDPAVEMGDYIKGYLNEAGVVPPRVSLNAMTKAAGQIEEMGEGWLPARKAVRA